MSTEFARQMPSRVAAALSGLDRLGSSTASNREALAREIAATLGLPASAQPTIEVGVDASGNPYVDLRNDAGGPVGELTQLFWQNRGRQNTLQVVLGSVTNALGHHGPLTIAAYSEPGTLTPVSVAAGENYILPTDRPETAPNAQSVGYVRDETGTISLSHLNVRRIVPGAHIPGYPRGTTKTEHNTTYTLPLAKELDAGANVHTSHELRYLAHDQAIPAKDIQSDHEDLAQAAKPKTETVSKARFTAEMEALGLQEIVPLSIPARAEVRGEVSATAVEENPAAGNLAKSGQQPDRRSSTSRA